MLHGHCHGKLDEHNRLSNDLRFDVGIDGELAKRAGGFIAKMLAVHKNGRFYGRGLQKSTAVHEKGCFYG